MEQPAIEPLGEAKPNTEAFRMLAERLGFDDPAFRETDSELIDAMLADCTRGVPPMRLRERGWLKIDLGQGPPTRRGRVRHRPTGGRCCTRATSRPPRWPTASWPTRYPLALVTPKTHLFLNSTFANQARQHSAQPEPSVFVHRDDAAARGIADGARVRVFNDRGEFTCAASVSDDARQGVLVAPMGWWNRDYEGGAAARPPPPSA